MLSVTKFLTIEVFIANSARIYTFNLVFVVRGLMEELKLSQTSAQSEVVCLLKELNPDQVSGLGRRV